MEGTCLPDGSALKRVVIPSFYFNFGVPLLWLINGQILKRMLCWLLFRGGGGGVNDLNQKGAKQSGNTGDNILNHDFLMCMLGAHYII